MNKILLLFISMCISTSFAQSIEETRKFPQDIKDYKKTEESFLEKSKDTTLQLVLFDKTKFDNLLLDNNDLINDAEDLNSKIINYFKLNNEIQTNKNKKIKKSKKIIPNEEVQKGFFLITKYFFVGKDKPYKLDSHEDNEDLDAQIYKESKCNEGICISHIIMGINYFDENLNIKPLNIDKFSNHIYSKEENIIRANYEKSQEGILKVYYIYGVNGLILPKDKSLIKKIIENSQK